MAIALAASFFAPAPQALAADAVGALNSTPDASQANMTWHNGPIQKTPRSYVVFWGWPATLTATQSSYQNQLKGLLGNIGGTSFLNIETQYTGTSTQGAITNPAGQLAGAWADATAAPAAPTPAQIVAEGRKLSSHFANTSPDSSFWVSLPPGHDPTDFPTHGGNACAWHTWDAPASGAALAIVNLPYMPDANNCSGTPGYYDGMHQAVVHELSETHTDPRLTAWYSGTLEGEIADKCAYGDDVHTVGPRRRKFGTASYVVQPLWSNRDHHCEFFLLPPRNITVSNSASGTTGTASSSCSFSMGALNGGDDGTVTGQTVSTSGVALSSQVTCTISTSDLTAPSGSQTYSQNASSATASVSGSAAPYGEKGRNQLCVSGAEGYIGQTVAVPTRCVTF